MGSISDNRSGKSYAYRSSKTALNAIMHSAAIDLLPTKIQILLLHPGWVKTNMTGPQAPLDSNQSVAGMLQVADNATDIPSGAFLDYQGNSIPW